MRTSFDFLHGLWNVQNRKLADPLQPDRVRWLEFESTVETRPILAGAGNIDLYTAPSFPDRPGFEGITLRLYDGTEDVWRIWWASTASDGRVDHPVIGRFDGDHGRFRCDDVIAGRATKVLYEWLEVDSSTPFWRQSFSFDHGSSWSVNWEMRFTRVGR